jgi:predicted transcriptional regulator
MGNATPQPLSAAQMEIMEVVWDRGEVTVGEIWKILAARRSIARNTVQTTVVRLEQRGWLEHRDEGGVFYYAAAHPRRAAVGGLVRRLVDTAFKGSVSGLVMALLENYKLTPEEAERLKPLIERSESGGEGRP